jgi:hypothetical protein
MPSAIRTELAGPPKHVLLPDKNCSILTSSDRRPSAWRCGIFPHASPSDERVNPRDKKAQYPQSHGADTNTSGYRGLDPSVSGLVAELPNKFGGAIRSQRRLKIAAKGERARAHCDRDYANDLKEATNHVLDTPRGRRSEASRHESYHFLSDIHITGIPGPVSTGVATIEGSRCRRARPTLPYHGCARVGQNGMLV